MRREGRQHGMVQSYRIMGPPFDPRPRPETRYLINRYESRPTAGHFTKVSSKPTNHSRFTGRWGSHTHPVSKSMHKAKGTQKLRYFDVVSNHRLVSWRVVDSDPAGLKLSGFPAGGVSDHLDWDNMGDHDFVGEELEIASGAVCDVEYKDDDEK